MHTFLCYKPQTSTQNSFDLFNTSFYRHKGNHWYEYVGGLCLYMIHIILIS